MSTLPATAVLEQLYPVLTKTPELYHEIIQANLGSGQLSVFDLERIRIPTGGGTSWTIASLDGDHEARDFEGIILHWREPRAYWRSSFDATGGGTPPDCSSDDGIRGIGTPGGACETCHLARFGSDDNGRGQACKQMRMLFVLLPGNFLPAVMLLPPTSLAACRKFFLRLTSLEIPYYGVLTKFSLEKTKNKQGIAYAEVRFGVARKLQPEETANVKRLIESIKPSLQRVRGQLQEEKEIREEMPL